MNIVVDSCVIVAAVKLGEPSHQLCARVLEHANERGDEAWLPMTAFWEIGAALDHPGKNTPDVTKFAKTFDQSFKFVTIDEALFQRTWKSDLRIPVTVYDRVFLSCALDKGAILVSTDPDLLKHAHKWGVDCVSPEAYLNQA